MNATKLLLSDRIRLTHKVMGAMLMRIITTIEPEFDVTDAIPDISEWYYFEKEKNWLYVSFEMIDCVIDEIEEQHNVSNNQ